MSLAAAQLVVAREHGCSSWPQLKAMVEERLMDRQQKVRAFVLASISGHTDRARRIFAADPSLASYDIWTAAVLGEASHVRRLLARNPSLAVEPDPESGWTPLLAVCNSRWHQLDPQRGPGLCAVAEALMDAGADPNTSVGRPPQFGHCSTLYAAAGLANNPELAWLLLKRGADPDTPAALYHTAFLRDRVCLHLLLDAGARAEGGDALAAAISMGDAEAVRLLLDAGMDPVRPLPAPALGESYAAEPPVGAVHAAVQFECGVELVTLLLERGADADGRGQDGGRSAYRLAVRQGRAEVADLLESHGARSEATDVDRFLGACVRADRDEADRRLARRPGLVGELTGDDHRALIHAAHGNLDAVRLMLALGFPVNAPVGDDGATPLHVAAGAGAAEVVALLLERGADLHATDTTWEAPPLHWATVGSGFRLGHAPHADWVATVRLLIDGGATTEGAWIVGKPPSAEVAAVLHAYGVEAPADEDEDGA